MAYEKQTWVNRVVSEGTGQVVEHGTIVSAERLNHLEDGVYNAHESIPTKVSDLTNDKGYLVASDIANKVDKVSGKGLSTEDYTTEEKTKLAGIPANTKESIDALQAGLGTKVDKADGKGLSTNDFTTPLKNKLDKIPENTNELIADLQTKVDDFSCWPVVLPGEMEGIDFKPGIRYYLGTARGIRYNLVDGKNGSEWYITFDTKDGDPIIEHSAGVITHGFTPKPNSHIEMSILQFGDGDNKRLELIGVCIEG